MVRAFSRAGFRVAFSYNKSADAANNLIEELEQSCGGMAFCCDLSKRESAEELSSEVLERFGPVDVLINNAGVSSYGLIQDVDAVEFDRVMDVNFRSAFFLTSKLIEPMIRNQEGRVINVSSVWGETGGACEALYSASKAALIGFTKALSKELAPSNITVNCICPGVVDTDMMNSFSVEEKSASENEIPIGRFASPEEISQAALFLAGEGASYITGQILGINGGMYC